MIFINIITTQINENLLIFCRKVLIAKSKSQAEILWTGKEIKVDLDDNDNAAGGDDNDRCNKLESTVTTTSTALRESSLFGGGIRRSLTQVSRSTFESGVPLILTVN